MAKIIPAVNKKGGVAKTTSIVNLAYALLRKGKRVLIIDLDPQASLTEYYGHDPDELDQNQQSLYFALADAQPIRDTILNEGQPHLIAAGESLRIVEDELVENQTTLALLRSRLQGLQADYDYILIDCPPGIGLLTKNALTAADGVVIPVETQLLPYKALLRFMPNFETVRSSTNPRLKLLGILPTKYVQIESVHNAVLEALRDEFGTRTTVFEPIHKRSAFQKAEVRNLSVLEAYPGLVGVEGYYQLAEHIINHA